MRRALWVSSGIGALLLGVFSIRCGFQMIELIEAGQPYTLNLYFHPITAIFFVVLLCIFLYPLVTKK